MLIASDGGAIYLANFTGSQQTVQILLKTLENCDLLRVSPSPDKTKFAALCADANEVVVGNLLAANAEIEKIDMGFAVTTFRWHPL